jgi:hypothetical protein
MTYLMITACMLSQSMLTNLLRVKDLFARYRAHRCDEPCDASVQQEAVEVVLFSLSVHGIVFQAALGQVGGRMMRIRGALQCTLSSSRDVQRS